jgi:uncharacterized protein (TIGR00255 family)
MKSMTGFGYSETQDNKIHQIMEIKSYNHRYLDLVMYLPNNLKQLEPQIREYLGEHIKRGRVELYLRIKELEEDITVVVDKNAALAYVKSLEELKKTTGITDEIHLSHLIRLEGILKLENKRETDFYWTYVKTSLSKALKDYELSRVVEGKKIEDDLTNLLNIIQTEIEFIDKHRDEIEKYIKEELRKRFFQLLGEQIDENRIYAETALLLIKYDIHEEIMRIKAHLGNFLEIMRKDESIGKNLDFIAQELNREINTIGAKNIKLEISQSIIRVKDTIEKIKEQLRNVE